MSGKLFCFIVLLSVVAIAGYAGEANISETATVKSIPTKTINQVNQSIPMKSFLYAEAILKAWEDNYTHFSSMKVAYTERVLEAIAPADNPNRYDGLVRLMHVERTEQGTRFHIRYSCDEDGFAKPDNIIGGSFDGEITREYIAVEKSGMIIAGMIGRNTENMNILKTYMLLSRNLLTKKNPSGPFDIYWIEDPNSKPQLSRVLLCIEHRKTRAYTFLNIEKLKLAHFNILA